jgi:hypothetical protein
MTRLSDTQAIILGAAAQRADHVALPLPDTLRGGAAAKVVRAMLAKGFLREVNADLRKGEPIWRDTGDGHGVTLVATDAGLAAIGIAPEHGDSAIKADPAPKTHTPRAGTKQARLIEMLLTPDGATIAEIVTALDWQPHTARGALSGALKKRLGLTITSRKDEVRGRVYHLTA